VILFVHFLGFNTLEASLGSKPTPGTRKDVATEVYNTTQSIGLALGLDSGRLDAQDRRAKCSLFRLCGADVVLACTKRRTP
jgi:hypothetical protein